MAAALKSSCHSRPTYQNQSGTGMRPSLLAGPQAGRDFAKGPEWRLACAADISEQTAQSQYKPLFSPALQHRGWGAETGVGDGGGGARAGAPIMSAACQS